MTTDFFGCLHTEEVRGHKMRVFNPFLKKNIYLRMHRKTRTYFRWVPLAGGPKVLLFFNYANLFDRKKHRSKSKITKIHAGSSIIYIRPHRRILFIVPDAIRLPLP